MKKVNLAVVGATGMVGRTFIKVLEERNLPIDNIYFFSSSRSAGSTVTSTTRNMWWKSSPRHPLTEE